MIEQMRADFADAASWEGWSEADKAEIGAVIREAIAANDVEALAYWSRELARGAEEWRRFRSRVREAEARIRARKVGAG